MAHPRTRPTFCSVSDSDWRQESHLVRCEWGPAGAARVGTGAAVVVVDVLSFSTSVSVLVERGTAVYPAAWRDARAADLARQHRAELAVGRREVSEQTPWSLSPAALLRAAAPERLVLPSPNGSAIAAASTGPVFSACLRNAAAVGRHLRQQGFGTERPVCLVPAGERWPDGSLRPALEDLLGAGAVLAHLGLADEVLSPEAAAARSLFAGLDERALVRAVRDCASGQELIRSGFGQDVEVAIQVDASRVVPALQGGCFRAAPAERQVPLTDGWRPTQT